MPFADELLGRDAVVDLSTILGGGAALPGLRRVADGLDGLGFRERVNAIRGAVLEDVPGDFPGLAGLVRNALRDPRFTGWMTFPVTEAVAIRGQEHVEDALALLAALTPRLTAETALRWFLDEHLERCLAVVREWTVHPDEHVRRLASEGVRPRLPWAPQARRLVADPGPIVPILDALYRDESEYVRRSVANCVNDISRDHPELAVRIAQGWLAEPDGSTASVARHALRTLIKRSDVEALACIGVDARAAIDVAGPRVRTPVVTMGEELAFDCRVTLEGSARARVAADYVIHFASARGAEREKVFKLGVRDLEPGASWDIARRHRFTPISTRRYYDGEHAVSIQVNGVRTDRAGFLLDGAGPR
ncbi:DNA alkylation repair protein [Hoyosella sp. G463]|uniref:DNA alkylation repair protein n=1 Tax=Lolliginicoccus lacisalsi TaxID=2742202 RepID=A0A927JD11_9ACTN|nr:DNA alkylation repair protein [Lolliginicoccus lacisalsi]MBD8507084.1 DNA alkylation repair protein [Lolliginicoccus lacisalsi]